METYQYDPYGNLTSSTGSVANPWRFAGGYFDSGTGLYKFGARYYDPTLGRWSQQDPLRGQLKGCHNDFCVMMRNEKALNPVQTWLVGFSAM